jgi:hypothetical protein
MLKSLRRGVPRSERADSPHEAAQRLARAYASAPVDLHMDIAYAGMKVGEEDLVEFVRRCLAEADTAMIRHKVLHRPLASFFLARYFLYALGIEGERAECGVFLGASALIACAAAQTRIPSYSGAGLHLIDSFEGLADPREEDRFEGSGPVDARSYGRGAYMAPIEHARRALARFPDVAFHKGWIPAVFEELPASRWSFVHLDVDHYAPTHAALEYFHPRLAPGGVIVCDDYGSPTFPGAQRAWHAYCEKHGVPFVVLDTGQAVILKA